MSTLIERLHELSLIHHSSEVGKALADAEFEVDRLRAIDDENTRLRSELERLQKRAEELESILQCLVLVRGAIVRQPTSIAGTSLTIGDLLAKAQKDTADLKQAESEAYARASAALAGQSDRG